MKDNDFEIRRYSPSDREAWDSFVGRSRNSTFLFNRGYMDYHADRFDDFSLMAMRDGRLCALLPADVTPDGIIHSHRGLTYGGWILPPSHLDGVGVLHIFEAMVAFCRAEGLSGLDYKALPYIYSSYPSQEDIYALFRLGASVAQCDLSSALDLYSPPGFNTLQRRLLRKAAAASPVVECSPAEGKWDVAPFWNMLSACLEERHGANPVHSLHELQLLRDRFPSEIRIFTALSPASGLPAAGVCLYVTDMVAHCQYICTTPEGRAMNLLPYLFDFLINEEYNPASNPLRTQRWFDFGTSNEDSGRILNEGLLRQKFSFGATGVAHQRFCLSF